MKLESRPRSLGPGERRRIIEEARSLLEENRDTVFAYLHGSLLGEGPVRDVDLAAWIRSGVDPLDYVLRLGLALEERIGIPVDVQVLNTAPPPFRYRVYKRGLLLVVRDRVVHDLEVAKAPLMYSDVVVLRRIASHLNLKYIDAGTL